MNATPTDEAFERALKDPSRVFPAPAAVLRSDLSPSRKVEVLRRWELDARELAVADDESMVGDAPSGILLQQIRDALRALGAGGDPRNAAPTMHGGHG
jgi:hypothetical protein